MNRQNIIEGYPLSPLQHGMLFHHLSAPGSGTDIEQIVCTLCENLEVPVLRRAWERVVERHPALRTAFRFEEGGDPIQVVQPQVRMPWQEHDWRGLSTPDQTGHLAVFLTADRRRGFKMSEAPLLRLTLVRLDETEYQLVWTFHHALLDGRSFPLVLKGYLHFTSRFELDRI